MRPINIPADGPLTAIGSSPPVKVDYMQSEFKIGFGCIVTGTVTYTVEHSFEDALQLGAANVTWFPHETVVGATANDDGNYAFPVRAIRLTVTAVAGGTVKMILLQGNGD